MDFLSLFDEIASRSGENSDMDYDKIRSIIEMQCLDRQKVKEAIDDEWHQFYINEPVWSIRIKMKLGL